MCEGKTENRNERNIMILFLSNLHGYEGKDQNANKLMWTSSSANYIISQPNPIQCMETNEAPLAEVLVSLMKPLDAIFYFSTNQVGMYPPPADRVLEENVTICVSSFENEIGHYDSQAHFFWSERAPKRIVDDIFAGKTKLIPVQFDEDASDPVKSTITSVTDMEIAIKEYLRQEGVLGSGEKPLLNCKLYADITGGMRTANIAMSAVMQLLHYEGAELKRVVYSDYVKDRPKNPVSNVQPISDMYQLVAGMYAFTEYGRSEAFEDYFKGENYEPLVLLRDAMDKFSETMQLCETDAIEECLTKLMNQIDNFLSNVSNNTNQSAKVKLFFNMVPNLRAVYSDLLVHNEGGEPIMADRLKILDWCVKRKLWQQAITFSTEWLPEFLVDYGIAFTDDPAIQKYCYDKKSNDKKSSNKKELTDKVGKKYFIMKFCTKSPTQKEEKSKDATIMDCITAYAAKEQIYARIDETARRYNIELKMKSSIGEWASDRWKSLSDQSVKEFNRNLEALPQELEKFKKELINTTGNSIKTGNIIKRNSIINKILRYKWNHIDVESRPVYEQFVRKRKIAAVYTYLYEMPLDTLMDIFELSFARRYNYNDDNSNIINEMLQCGMVETELETKEEAAEFVETYTYIRAELRNKMNHANAIGLTVEKIEKDMQSYLKKLFQIRETKKHIFIGLWAEDTKEAKP